MRGALFYVYVQNIFKNLSAQRNRHFLYIAPPPSKVLAAIKFEQGLFVVDQPANNPMREMLHHKRLHT
ncbi:MAG TPA: hypothetical protein IAA70_00530 [Candidatus Avoscillospira stercoripullorum]|uniref:Uncharacterized protein n=1 Tax=Candidatus Avoscillospira stercoripullorum TaxID=2840709 RepID=A0A9D1A6M1_9FIRM|nr:hypothetical protein [Candidatus Avoscillospira stercoripullorum]